MSSGGKGSRRNVLDIRVFYYNRSPILYYV